MTRCEVIDWATSIVEDVDLTVVKEWLADNPGRKAVGYLPVYLPREVIAANGMLPVGILGGGDRIEIIRGDAYYQSYICHLPRSVVELALSGRLDMLSALLFPSTCDVIRNLSGMWKLMRPDLYVRYLDVPQISDLDLAETFWTQELQTVTDELGEIAGKQATDSDFNEAIAQYNEARSLIRSLYHTRRKAPWNVPTSDLYTLLRAGEVVPVATFINRMRQYLQAVEDEPLRPRDNCRVVVVGAFCEQPPLGLIKTIERAGCYIVDDDFVLGNRTIVADVPIEDEPLRALARTSIRHGQASSLIFEPDRGAKSRLVGDRVRAAGADGVIFAAPSFCDPALLDRPMLRAGAEAQDIPCIAFKYSENGGQFQQYREQAGTFSDSIKLWGGR